VFFIADWALQTGWHYWLPAAAVSSAVWCAVWW